MNGKLKRVNERTSIPYHGEIRILLHAEPGPHADHREALDLRHTPPDRRSARERVDIASNKPQPDAAAVVDVQSWDPRSRQMYTTHPPLQPRGNQRIRSFG